MLTYLINNYKNTLPIKHNCSFHFCTIFLNIFKLWFYTVTNKMLMKPITTSTVKLCVTTVFFFLSIDRNCHLWWKSSAIAGNHSLGHKTVKFEFWQQIIWQTRKVNKLIGFSPFRVIYEFGRAFKNISLDYW